MSKRSVVLMFFGVWLATVLVYLPCVRYSFVSHDDQEYVYQNDHVKRGLTASNVLWAVKSCGYACNWHPLAWMSLQADAWASDELRVMSDELRVKSDEGRGKSDEGNGMQGLEGLAHVMHLHNVVLHGANAALLFALMVLLCGRGKASTVPLLALVALLWSIHPLRTEVVCWISERKELSSVFFMLLAMIAWCWGRRRLITYHLSLFTFALAVAAKPVAVSLPAALFAWDWVICRRPFVRSVIAQIPFALIAVGGAAMTLAAQVNAVEVGSCYTVLERIVMSVNAPVIYLRQTLWPVGLSIFYPIRPPIPWVETILGVVLLGAMAAVVIVWLKSLIPRPFPVPRSLFPLLPLLVFGIAWAYVALLPMLGIVKVGDQTHSDRYTYWAGCAFFAVAAMIGTRFVSGREKIAAQSMAVVLTVMTFATWQRMPVWSSSLALYCDSVPKSWEPQAVCALAQEFRRMEGDGFKRAEALLREALSHTKDLDVRAEYANLMAFKAQKSPFRLDESEPDPAFAEVKMEADFVLHYDPKNLRANEALAIVAEKEGDWTNAVRYLEKARESGRDIEWIDAELNACRDRLPKE